MKIHRSMIAFAVTCSVASIGDGALADTITLKSSVRLPASVNIITLESIAEIEGETAMQFAELPVAELKRGAVHEISIREVREKLDAAGAHWGVINLSGKTVVVRAARASEPALPLAMTPIAVESVERETSRQHSSRDDYLASDIASQATLRA